MTTLNNKRASLILILLLTSSSFLQFSYAEPNTIKPIKVMHNDKGETWLLPDGQFVLRSGGDVTKRVYDNSTNTWSANILTDNGNGNFHVISGRITTDFVGDRIYHQNQTMTQVSEEKIHLMKQVGNVYEDIPLTFVSRTNTSFSNIDLKNIKGYDVMDSVETLRIIENWTSNDVDLLIYYDFIEGQPLKHTYIPTSKIDATYRIYHDFIVNDIVKLKSIATNGTDATVESFDIDVTDVGIDVKKDNVKINDLVKPKTDAKTVSKLAKGEITKTPLEATIVKSEKTDVLRYSEITTSDGNLLFGEIVSPSTGNIAWKKFIELNIEQSDFTTFQFRYGDWSVKSGESFELDPDTYSSNNPTVDGYIDDITNNDVCDTGNAKNTSSSQLLSQIYPTFSPTDCFLSYLEFPLSGIPTTATVTDVDFTYDFQSTTAVDECDWISLGTVRATDSATTIFSAILSGSVMLNASGCTTPSDNSSVDFGTVGDSAVQTRVSAGDTYFSFGIKPDIFTPDASSVLGATIGSEEDGTAVPKPTLTITYSTVPVFATVTTDVYENDNSTSISGNINIANSTYSQLFPINSTGIALLTGLVNNTNYNMTIYDTDNMIVNRTINFLVTANETKSFDTDIFRVSCGTGDDVLIKVNETNAHYKTTHSTPECSTQTITWNSTFTALGNSTQSSNFTSTLYATILDLTNFDLNPTLFTVNGSTVPTTYDGVNATSDPFDIANGTSSVFLEFLLTLGDTPVADSGGGSGGGSSSNTNPVGAITDVLGMNFIDEIHRAILGQLLSDNIKVVWDSPNNLDIKAIIVADSPFNITFQKTPFTLLGNPSGTSNAEINYSVQIPSKFCSDGQTVGCVRPLRYEVTVEIQAVHDGFPITKNTVITIDLSGKTDIPFTFVLLAIGSVPVAFFARKLSSGKHKRTAQSSHGKSRKNGSSRKALEL